MVINKGPIKAKITIKTKPIKPKWLTYFLLIESMHPARNFTFSCISGSLFKSKSLITKSEDAMPSECVIAHLNDHQKVSQIFHFPLFLTSCTYSRINDSVKNINDED